MPDIDGPYNTSRPPIFGKHKFVFDEDPARYLLTPDVQFERPWISVPGGETFVFPLGTEGIKDSGTSELGIHKYLGDSDVDVTVIHRDEEHITLTGIFPGHTSVNNMLACKRVIRADTPSKGKILHIPFIFPRLQYVVVENYNFQHDESDRTQTIAYELTFVKVGTKNLVRPGDNGVPAANPTVSSAEPKGESTRTFTVRDGVRTLRAIAKKVYNDPDKWITLFNKNKKKIVNAGIDQHKAPTAKLPLGMKIAY